MMCVLDSTIIYFSLSLSSPSICGYGKIGCTEHSTAIHFGHFSISISPDDECGPYLQMTLAHNSIDFVILLMFAHVHRKR